MNDESPKKSQSIYDLVKFTFFAVIIILPIRFFIAKPFIVKGQSMDPTYHDGQYLLVDQISYRFHEPQRGDIVVFKYPHDTREFYIKRIIGLPGETVRYEDGKVTILNSAHPKGFELDEPYIKNMAFDSMGQEVLPDNEYFVMGDNRPASSDSRNWGTLNRRYIVGRPFIRLYPITQIGIYPGEANDY